MPDLERMAVTRCGLSFSEFWDSTPREFDMLVEQSAYKQQWEMNQVRHIMAAVVNTVVDRKKKPKGFSAKEMMPLSLIDGTGKTKDELETEQEMLQNTFEQMKKRHKDG